LFSILVAFFRIFLEGFKDILAFFTALALMMALLLATSLCTI